MRRLQGSGSIAGAVTFRPLPSNAGLTVSGPSSGQTLTERIGYGESGSTAPEGFAGGLQPRGLVLIIEYYPR